MKTKFVVTAILCGLFSPQIFAQSGNGASTGLAFLKIGVGARATGMAEAFAAVQNDASSTFWNPAGLANFNTTQITFSHTEWLQDINHDFLAVAFSAFGGGLGFSFYGTSVDGLERRVNPGEAIGTFQANNIAAGVSYGRPLNEEFSFGLTSKFLYEKTFTETASGYAFDFGLNWMLGQSPLTVAVVFQNLGSMSKLRSTSSKLPKLGRVSGAYEVAVSKIDGSLLLVAEGVKVFDADSWVSAGFELVVRRHLTFRGGYQAGFEEKGLAAGFGFQISRYQLDYGFTPFTAGLGNAQRFSLSVSL